MAAAISAISASKIRRFGWVVILAACAIVSLAANSVARAEQFRWTDVDRVVAISDPHGDFNALLNTLRNAGVIDDANNWSGGQTHLVITGDLLDRGADSRKVMDLVMSLEEQAPESGGMLHLTLGNHEVMNLVGDLRYVDVGEYAAFAADESAEIREHWFEKFKASHESANEAELRAAFDKVRPPGFYAHRKAFSSNGYYGSWLLSKPVMVVVNNTAYLHGGLPDLVSEYNLETLNAEMSSQVIEYVKQMEVLVNNDILDPAINFYEHSDVAEALATDTTLPADVAAATHSVVDLSGASIHGGQSPLWYRGTIGCSTPIEGATLQAALDAVGASRVVIGHTPTPTRTILQKHDGRVIEIDTGMNSSAYRGSGNALIIEDGIVMAKNENNAEAMTPAEHPRRVGRRPGNMTATELEQLLQSGEIVSRNPDEAGRDVVEVVSGDTKIKALFTANPRNRDFSPALATYRLDRMLGIDLVPVTVARELDGKRGALQFHPEKTPSEGDRAQSGRGSNATCALPKQWNAMYIFDALIYNKGRPPEGMLYSPDNWQLILSGNDNTFDSKRNKPAYLKDAPLEYSESWAEALSSLTDERLAEHLGDVLDDRRLDALSRRRDLLLKEATAK